MTRKDYIKVAEILKKASNNIEGKNEGTINYIGNDLVECSLKIIQGSIQINSGQRSTANEFLALARFLPKDCVA